ncbi:ATP-binding cassette domain-containing protein [Celeribacter litoreus]|uniref:ATP-binding cassette domain-containing protein n=1 Tax=Celeribacter litoreus TaxID=2876714 RepID=UPI001CD01C26|nr:ABC transporter ATP-binding protein [Celeribacter litoreus]MCA0043873.1 ABC transporter ATP-binding protein [Celeribacter litoreus]
MSVSGIELSGLNVYTVDRTILSDVSLNLPERGLVGFIGPMGSGKSTLFRFLAGHLEHYNLTADFLKADCKGAPLGAENRVALFAQRPREAANDAESSRDLANFRLSLLKDYIQVPGQVLCVDEPTAGLWDDECSEMMAVLLELAKERLVLMATHQMNLISSSWSGVILLGAGRVLAHCNAAAFLSGDSGPEIEHFRKTNGLIIAREDAEIHALDPSLRGLPDGIGENILPPGNCGWIIPNKFWYADESECVCCLWQADTEYELTDRCLKRTSGTATLMADAPLDDESIITIAKDIADEIAKKHTVLLRNRRMSEFAPRLLGALLVCLGVAPDKAGEAVNQKSSLADLGIEPFLWDLDLRLAMELN